jgi:hypothetical protein
MPFDDGIEHLDNDQGSHRAGLENGLGRIAEPEPTNDDVDVARAQARERQTRKGDFRRREQTRHQKFIAQLDLEHVHAERRLTAAPKAQSAKWRWPIVQFLETRAHADRCDAFVRDAVIMSLT